METFIESKIASIHQHREAAEGQMQSEVVKLVCNGKDHSYTFG